MNVFNGLEDIPSGFGPSIVSVGNFDGVHRGHSLILQAMRKTAISDTSLSYPADSIKTVAVTFDPHPSRVLRPQNGLKLITPLPTRLKLLEKAGADATLVLPFTPQLAGMRAGDFITAILEDALQTIEVHEGPNFRFGYRAEGGVEEMREFGRERGFKVVIHAPCTFRGLEVSSTKVRELVSNGDMANARRLLGRSFFIDSTPAPGRGIGSRLTVPTVNLAPYSELLPRNGVYVTRLRAGKEWFDAVTNVGNRPTFGADSFAVESHLLDFRPVELEQQTPIRLVFCQRIREERQWPSPAALKAQILKDAAYARRYLERLHSLESSRAADQAVK